jgi:torulene dioxygenase
MLNTEVTPPEYNVFEINSSGKGNILATITDAPAAYIHSMFSTANYVILIVWQSDFGKVTSKPYYNVLDNIKDWDPERKTLFCESKTEILSNFQLILF